MLYQLIMIMPMDNGLDDLRHGLGYEESQPYMNICSHWSYHAERANTPKWRILHAATLNLITSRFPYLVSKELARTEALCEFEIPYLDESSPFTIEACGNLEVTLCRFSTANICHGSRS